MSNPQEEFNERIRNATKPVWADLVRSKRLVLELVSDGAVHGTGTIQQVLTEAEEIGPPQHGEQLQVQRVDEMSDPDIADHLLVKRARYWLTASEALIDLASQGILVEVATAHSGAHPVVSGGGNVTIGVKVGGSSYGVSVTSQMPNLPQGFRLAPRHRHEGKPWLTEPDLFVADISPLPLDARAKRCIGEALVSYDRGLYLACGEPAWSCQRRRLVFRRRSTRGV